jgi:hypothetical protein
MAVPFALDAVRLVVASLDKPSFALKEHLALAVGVEFLVALVDSAVSVHMDPHLGHFAS